MSLIGDDNVTEVYYSKYCNHFTQVLEYITRVHIYLRCSLLQLLLLLSNLGFDDLLNVFDRLQLWQTGDRTRHLFRQSHHALIEDLFSLAHHRLGSRLKLDRYSRELWRLNILV